MRLRRFILPLWVLVVSIILLTSCSENSDNSSEEVLNVDKMINDSFKINTDRDSTYASIIEKYSATSFPPKAWLENEVGYFSFKPTLFYQKFIDEHNNTKFITKSFIRDIERIDNKYFVELIVPMSESMKQMGDEPPSILFNVEVTGDLAEKAYSIMESRNFISMYRSTWFFYPDCYAIIQLDSVRKRQTLNINPTIISGCEEVDLNLVNNMRLQGFGRIIDILKYK